MHAAAISKMTAYEPVAVMIIRMTNNVMERRARIVTFEAPYLGGRAPPRFANFEAE
jgi:hypothetical protein